MSDDTIEDLLDAAERYAEAKRTLNKAREGVAYPNSYYTQHEQDAVNEARAAFATAFAAAVRSVIESK